MADLTVTPDLVQPSPKALLSRGISGGVINAGDVVARKVNGQFVQADANDTTPNETINVPVGVATCSCLGPNQNLTYVAGDALFTLGGATTVSGEPYFLSGTAGKICPATDLASGMRSSLVGWGQPIPTGGTANFIVNIVSSGQTI